MTEDQAKQKWCPMVRRDGCEEVPNSFNRTAIYRGDLGIDQCLCIASDCMMHRWVPDFLLRLANGMAVIIDADDEERVLSTKWWWDGRYVKASDGYLHRLIASIHYGVIPDGLVVDHIDGDPLNNRSGNLRVCTQAENIANSKPRGGKSIYRGVSLSRNGRWYAQISKDGQRECLGTFDTEKEAAEAFDKAANRIHGEYANLNLTSKSNVGRQCYCGLAGKL